jgi:signal peptidase I
MTKQDRIKKRPKKQKKRSTKTTAQQPIDDYVKLKHKLAIVQKIVSLCVIVGCVIFLIRVKTHQVSGESMAPTFENRDRIFVAKKQEPKRLDIVTFSPKNNAKESYVKRVIGIPGDTIWLEENKLFINHQMKERAQQPISDTDKRAIDLPDGTIKVDVSVDVMNQLKGLTKIPKNQYFLLGDNRNHSTDSRMMGLIDQAQIEGVVTFRYYPLNRCGFVR